MGLFYESDFEEALVDLLKDQGWEYTHGNEIHRNNREIIIENDLKGYLERLSLNDSEISDIIEKLKHVPGQSTFDILRNTTKLVRDGFRIYRDDTPFDVLNTLISTVHERINFVWSTSSKWGMAIKMMFGFPMCSFL